jgi:hypothetical protein
VRCRRPFHAVAADGYNFPMLTNDEWRALEERLRQRGHTLDFPHRGVDGTMRLMVDNIPMHEGEMTELDRRETVTTT